MDEVTARRELRAFFQSFGLQDEVTLAQRVEAMASECLPAQLLAHGRARVAAWVTTVLGSELLETEKTVLALGRAALLLSGATAEHPQMFLSDSISPEWTARIRAAVPMAHPPSSRGHMLEQSLRPIPAIRAVARFLSPIDTGGEGNSSEQAQ